jgi:signal transduction histidine kinase
LNVGAFTALGLVAVRQWLTRRDDAAKWLALSFGGLGSIVLLGLVVPKHPDSFFENALVRVEIAILVLFPYGLYRFTRAFSAPHQGVRRFVSLMTLAMVVWTFVLPHFVEEGEHRTASFDAYLVGFLVHWTVLTVVVAYRLWRAGRAQPGVARRRMRMLAFAAAAVTVALFFSASSSNTDSGVAFISQVLAILSGLAFLLGLSPPPIVRQLWRRREQVRLQNAISDLMKFANSPKEIAERVLEPMADIVGARAIAIRNGDGETIGEYVRAGNDHFQTVEIPFEGGSLEVHTSPYAPFFGDDEFRVLRTLGAMTGLALDRARLYAQEHESRVALERADELKSNFIALAAHELRTPVTTVLGTVQTLHRLEGRLSPEQERELKAALETQSERMALLVEQLLDLSRLDADAIEIHPESVRVQERLRQLVQDAAGPKQDADEVQVKEDFEASLDVMVLERVVGNLVTNALRYGNPPVVVTATRSDHHVRIAVEDHGRGVDPDFVPDLFERFARSDSSRALAKGTGLGLAIARAYARAHHGDLFYEPLEPHGARFELVLPA